MTRDPNVDRALGECWLVSDMLIADIRTDIAALKANAARWEPRPYQPKKETP